MGVCVLLLHWLHHLSKGEAAYGTTILKVFTLATCTLKGCASLFSRSPWIRLTGQLLYSSFVAGSQKSQLLRSWTSCQSLTRLPSGPTVLAWMGLQSSSSTTCPCQCPATRGGSGSRGFRPWCRVSLPGLFLKAKQIIFKLALTMEMKDWQSADIEIWWRCGSGKYTGFDLMSWYIFALLLLPV